MKVLDKFITILGFQTDTKGLKEAEGSLNEFKRNTVKLYAAVAAVFGGGFVLNRVAEATDKMGDFANTVGIAVEDLNALEYAANIVGGSAEGMRNTIYRLNQMIGDASRGTGELLQAFGEYGIRVTDNNGRMMNTVQILDALNRRFQNMSKFQQLELASRLGIDQETIRLLQLAPAQFDMLISRAKRLGGITKESADAAGEYADALYDVRFAASALARSLLADVLPRSTQMLNTIAETIAILPQYSRFFKILGGVIASVAGIWAGLNVQIVITKALLFAIPLAIAALIAAIALLIDDVVAFYRGQESVIGQFEIMRKLLNALAVVAKSTWAGITAAIGFAVDKIKAFKDILFGVTDKLSGGFGRFFGGFEDFFGVTDKLSGGFGRFFGGFEDFFGGMSLVGPGGIAPLAPLFSAPSGGAPSINTGEINITVPGGDSKEIAANIVDELNNQYRNTAQNFDSRVAR